MFPEAPSSSMTVLTVTQRTENDMTAWSEEVDQEREQLLARVGLVHSHTIARSAEKKKKSEKKIKVCYYVVKSAIQDEQADIKDLGYGYD